MKIEIVKISIVIMNEGVAHVTLYTTLPESCWPYEGDLGLQFKVPRNQALEYVEKHFPGVPVDVIDGSFPRPKFTK